MPAVTKEELVTDFPPRIRPTAAIRSTVLVTEHAILRDRGLYETYRGHLGEAGRDVLDAIAGTWIAVPQARAHYDACGRLGLTADEQQRFGWEIEQRVEKLILGTALSLAGALDASPWTLVAQTGRVWGRAFDGGALRVVKIGPKDARLDVAQNELLQAPFLRNTFRGFVQRLVTPFCRKVIVQELARHDRPHHAFRVQWV